VFSDGDTEYSKVACLISKGEIYRKADTHAVDWEILGFYHGLINYIDTKAKCRHLKRDFAAGIYRSLYTGDTFIHAFDPALRTVATLTFSLVQLSPPPSSCSGLRQINTCRKVPLQVNI
jgi:hypothetical protein